MIIPLNTKVIKRVYEEAANADGHLMLVVRVWPRSISKELAHIEERLKETAPGTELRKWFGHETYKYPEFNRRYTKELENMTHDIERIRRLARTQRVTLVYGAKDEVLDQSVVLREVLLKKG